MKTYQYVLDGWKLYNLPLLMITTGKIYISLVLSFYIDVYFSFLLFHYQ